MADFNIKLTELLEKNAKTDKLNVTDTKKLIAALLEAVKTNKLSAETAAEYLDAVKNSESMKLFFEAGIFPDEFVNKMVAYLMSESRFLGSFSNLKRFLNVAAILLRPGTMPSVHLLLCWAVKQTKKQKDYQKSAAILKTCFGKRLPELKALDTSSWPDETQKSWSAWLKVVFESATGTAQPEIAPTVPAPEPPVIQNVPLTTPSVARTSVVMSRPRPGRTSVPITVVHNTDLLDMVAVFQEELDYQRAENEDLYTRLKGIFGAEAAHQSQMRDAYKSELSRVLTPSYRDYLNFADKERDNSYYLSALYTLEAVFDLLKRHGVRLEK